MLQLFPFGLNYSDTLLYGECLPCQEVSVYIQLTLPHVFDSRVTKYERTLLSENCIFTTMSSVQTLEKYIGGIFKMFPKSLLIRDIQNSIII